MASYTGLSQQVFEKCVAWLYRRRSYTVHCNECYVQSIGTQFLDAHHLMTAMSNTIFGFFTGSSWSTCTSTRSCTSTTIKAMAQSSKRERERRREEGRRGKERGERGCDEREEREGGLYYALSEMINFTYLSWRN